MENIENLKEKIGDLIDLNKNIEVLNLLSDEQLTKYNSEKLYNLRGIAYSKLGRNDEALMDYTKAIILNPLESIYYSHRSQVYLNLMKMDEAMKDANHALELNPVKAFGYDVRGQCWSALKQYDQAISDYTKAINLDTTSSTLYNNRGTVFSKINQFNKAIEDFTKAIKYKPDEALYFHNRGIVLRDLQKYDKALSDFNEALRLDCGNNIYYMERAECFSGLKEYDKAISDLKNIIHIDETNDLLFYKIGLYYLLKNEYSLAIPYFKRAYFLKPEHPRQLLEISAKRLFAPFLIHEILSREFDIKNMNIYNSEITFSEMTCVKWNLILKFCDIQRDIFLETTAVLKLSAIVNFYMGNEIKSFNIYKNELGLVNLEIRDLYYYSLSAEKFLEPNKSIINFAIEKIEKKKIFSNEEFYYCALLYLLNNQYDKAEIFFQSAIDFPPALFGLIGLYNFQNNSEKLEGIISRIEILENDVSEFGLANGNTPIRLDLSINLNAINTEFNNRLFYYELTDELNIAKTLLNSESVDNLEFYDLVEFDTEFEKLILSKVDLNESKNFEKELSKTYCISSNRLSLDEIFKEIQNNADAKKIILQIEQNIERFETSAEKEISIIINQFKEPASWYILLIKYFYLTKKIGSRISVILHFYVLKVSHQKKDSQNIEIIEDEIKTWANLLSIILKSHFLLKVLNNFWAYIVTDAPEYELDQYENYRQFKQNFRKDFLPFWRETICKMELAKNGFSFEV